MTRKTWFALLLIPLLLGTACRKAAPKAEVQAARPPGMIAGEIKLSASSLTIDEGYAVSYVLHNGTSVKLNVVRIETGTGRLAPGSADWRNSVVDTGQSVEIARVNGRATAPGTVKFTASFVTDQGGVIAQPAQLTVAARATGAPAGAPAPGAIRGIVTIAPDQVAPGQPATISYELVDSTDQELLVPSLQTDSAPPLTRDYPGWIADRVAPGTRAVIARRVVARTEPGSYSYPAQFNTNKGLFTAPPATLVVQAVAAPKVDTGRVSVAIAITPNPVKRDGNYVIDYQVNNTTQDQVLVGSIRTDLGTYTPSSPEWVTDRAAPGMTTVIARLRGKGEAPGSRNKTATFETNLGLMPAAPVMLTVEAGY